VPGVGVAAPGAGVLDLADVRLGRCVVEGGDAVSPGGTLTLRASTIRLCVDLVARGASVNASAGGHSAGIEVGRLSGSEHANVQVWSPISRFGRERVAGI
jgi:hypothetical protein